MSARPFAQRFRLAALRPSAHAPRRQDLHKPPPAPVPDSAEAALRAAVVADPANDGPRWDYARWCVRRGDPYGDFIAAQLREPSKREAVDHRSPWLGATLGALSARDVVFRRGFPEGMSLSGRAFVSRGDELFAAAPVEWVRLVAVDSVRGELAACPHFRRLRGLSLAGCRLGPLIGELAAAGVFAGLEWADLSGNEVG